MVEAGIVKHRLNYGLPKAEICPQNLGSIERQLRLNDLMTTYLTMLVGFTSGLVVFLVEASFFCSYDDHSLLSCKHFR